jgi:8-oxo-dGTP pyrophosphatase MutT (NUDIX family)
MTNDLIERIPQLLAKLRKRYGHLQWPGGRLENPDGPEAAAHIEALAERVRELEGEVTVSHRSILNLLDTVEMTLSTFETSPAAREVALDARRLIASAKADVTEASPRQARKDKENG